MRARVAGLYLVAVVGAACGTSRPAPPPDPSTVARPPPLAPGLAPVDSSFDPCVDFEVYACGPRFGKQAILRRPGDPMGTRARDYYNFIQEVENSKHLGQFIGAHDAGFYMMGCSTPDWRKAGFADLRPELDSVAAAANLDDLARRLGHLRALGQAILIDFGVTLQSIDGQSIVAGSVGLADSMVPATFYQPPHREALLNREHWQRLARLSGLVNPDEAEVAARVDSWLALMHPWDVDRVRPSRLLAPGSLDRRPFPWRTYFEGLGQNIAGPFATVEPEEIARVDALAKLPLAALKSYVRVLLIEGAAKLLSQELLDEEYRFHFLPEDEVMRSSWSMRRACSSAMPAHLGADLARAFLLRFSDHRGEERARRLLDAVRARLVSRVQSETEADPRVRENTVRAIERIVPLFVKETSAIEPDTPPGMPSSFLRFNFSLSQADFAIDLRHIGKVWDGEMPAFYLPARLLPTAGRLWLSPDLLGSPYLTAPPWGPATYGGLGAIIGHELGHLLPRALWPGAPKLAASWNGHSASLREDWLSCMGQLFDQITFSAKIPFDLRSSLDEFMSDLIGVRSAFEAMETATPAGDTASEMQRQRTFFVSLAQSFCALEDDDRSSVDSLFDPHPSMLLRVNGVVSQSAAFARAFGCQAGQPMAPALQCSSW